MRPHEREEVREQFMTDVIEVTAATNLEKRLTTRVAFVIPAMPALRLPKMQRTCHFPLTPKCAMRRGAMALSCATKATRW